MTNDLLRVRICIACNGQFSDEPCEPSECDILRVVENLDLETLRPKGRFEIKYCDEFDMLKRTCTVCGYVKWTDIHTSLDWNYCPHCGADMREG